MTDMESRIEYLDRREMAWITLTVTVGTSIETVIMSQEDSIRHYDSRGTEVGNYRSSSWWNAVEAKQITQPSPITPEPRQPEASIEYKESRARAAVTLEKGREAFKAWGIPFTEQTGKVLGEPRTFLMNSSLTLSFDEEGDRAGTWDGVSWRDRIQRGHITLDEPDSPGTEGIPTGIRSLLTRIPFRESAGTSMDGDVTYLDVEGQPVRFTLSGERLVSITYHVH